MTINSPVFSIITITLNNLTGLQKTRTSLQSQSCKDYEWIVIDGASNDGTREFLSKVILSEREGSHTIMPKDSSASPQNDRFSWISEPDRGLYDAMNKGIERASGDYLLFLNAGDALAAPDILAKIAAAIKTNCHPGGMWKPF